MDTSITVIISKPLSISEKLNTINTVDGVRNAPCIPNAEEQGIPVRIVHDKIRESVTGENVLRLLQTTQMQNTCVTSSQKVSKYNFSSPNFSKAFPVQ